MAGKSSDIVDRRLTNLTFTSAEYLRSRSQDGNSLEGRFRGVPCPVHGTRVTPPFPPTCHTCAAWSTADLRPFGVKKKEVGLQRKERVACARKIGKLHLLPLRDRRNSVISPLTQPRARAADRSGRDSANPACESSCLRSDLGGIKTSATRANYRYNSYERRRRREGDRRSGAFAEISLIARSEATRAGNRAALPPAERIRDDADNASSVPRNIETRVSKIWKSRN